MKYTKKERDDAALICAVCASTPNTMTHEAAFWLGLAPRGRAQQLAIKAVIADGATLASYVYPEAEALLRTGWEPTP